MPRLTPSPTWRSGLERTARSAAATLSAWSKRLAGVPGLRPVAATAGTLLVVFVSWKAWQGAQFDDVSVPALIAVAAFAVPLVLAADGAT